MLAALFCVAASVTATSLVYDPDVWWVAAAGREILATRSVPRQNLFSFTEPAHLWIMHEWLLGPAYALGLAEFGPAFLVGLALLLLGVGLSLVLWGTLGRTRHAAAGLLLALLAIACFGSRLLSARPTGVALVFPLAISVLAFTPRFSLLKAGICVLIELVWTNTHGSFPLGIVLLLVSALDEARDRSLRLVTLAASALVTLVNPYGVRLHEFVFDYLLGSRDIYLEIHQGIYEFRSLFGAWGRTSGPIELVGLMLVSWLAVSACLSRRWRVRGGFCLLLVALALMQVRHIELAGLLSLILLAPRGDELFSSFSSVDQRASRGPRYLSAALVSSALLVGVGAFLLRTRQHGADAWLSAGQGFLDSLAAIPNRSHVYVPFAEAGLAIWYGFPRRIRVYYDSRNDCYSPATSQAFVSFSDPGTTPTRLRQLLADSGTNAALVTRRHALGRFLAQEPGWQLLSENGTWRAFARVGLAPDRAWVRD